MLPLYINYVPTLNVIEKKKKKNYKNITYTNYNKIDGYWRRRRCRRSSRSKYVSPSPEQFEHDSVRPSESRLRHIFATGAGRAHFERAVLRTKRIKRRVETTVTRVTRSPGTRTFPKTRPERPEYTPSLARDEPAYNTIRIIRVSNVYSLSRTSCRCSRIPRN